MGKANCSISILLSKKVYIDMFSNLLLDFYGKLYYKTINTNILFIKNYSDFLFVNT